MTRKDKLIKRLLSKPSDFTTLLTGLEFEEGNTGIQEKQAVRDGDLLTRLVLLSAFINLILTIF